MNDLKQKYKNGYYLLKLTTGFDWLAKNVTEQALMEIARILEAYENKIKIVIPRDSEDYPIVEDIFVVVTDESYFTSGFETLVLKWFEGFEDTGYLSECLASVFY